MRAEAIRHVDTRHPIVFDLALIEIDKTLIHRLSNNRVKLRDVRAIERDDQRNVHVNFRQILARNMYRNLIY